MSPRLEELHAVFHDFVNNVGNIARHLPPLESWVRIKGRIAGGSGDTTTATYDHAFATPPGWYLEEAHFRLKAALRDHFEPVCDYMEELRLRYGAVYGLEVRRDTAAYARKERSLEECVAQVEDFNRLVREINGMVSGVPGCFGCGLEIQRGATDAKRSDCAVKYANDIRERHEDRRKAPTDILKYIPSDCRRCYRGDPWSFEPTRACNVILSFKRSSYIIA